MLGERRSGLLADLGGQVLDVGAGTGANLSHFRAASRVVAAEPDPAMRLRMAAKLADAPVPAEITCDDAEALRQPDASFDAVVFTQVLCTVTDPDRAFAEARRILRPRGRLIVLEHVRGTGGLARWQDHLTPLWSRLIPGCHLGRDTAAAIERAGFTIQQSELFDPFPRWVPPARRGRFLIHLDLVQCRYNPAQLARQVGAKWLLISQDWEQHVAPAGTI